MEMLNPHFEKLKTQYIFPIIERKLAELQKEHPNQRVINLGVGDVALPLSPIVAKAICDATIEMTEKVRGYGPCGGYDFLKEAIAKNEYGGLAIETDEIFISDGTNCDASALQELFAEGSSVCITDPTYPVYRDANIMAGKSIHFLPLLEENGFIPKPPKERTDFVYLCTPSNPTGVAMGRADLSEWIAWAKKHESILIIDNVYNAFITSPSVPRSIYQLEGAYEVAIELRSFSKWAGFTGLRCAYAVVPKKLHIPQLHSFWATRVDTKTNGIAYPIQRGAASCYSLEAKEQLQEQLSIYQTSAQLLRQALETHELPFYGGVDAPYIWLKNPPGLDSWAFFDELLEHSKIVTIPGSGFGPAGEGFVRLSCFLDITKAKEAADALLHHFTAV